MSEYLDVIERETSNIRFNASNLKSLAEAFYRTGNDNVGEQLASYAEDLLYSQKEINNVIGKEINDNLKQAKQSLADTLVACLHT